MSIESSSSSNSILRKLTSAPACTHSFYIQKIKSKQKIQFRIHSTVLTMIFDQAICAIKSTGVNNTNGQTLNNAQNGILDSNGGGSMIHNSTGGGSVTTKKWKPNACPDDDCPLFVKIMRGDSVGELIAECLKNPDVSRIASIFHSSCYSSFSS